MDQFCGGPFWNTTLLWANTWPQVTPCFLNLVVKGAPCVFFWLAVPCHVHRVETRHARYGYMLPVSRLSIAKLSCASILCVLSVLGFLIRVSRAHTQAFVVGDVLLLITLLGATVMTQYEKSRCIITSGPLFIFWTLKTFCDVIPFYTQIMLMEYRTAFEEFAVFVMSYVFTVLLMVLYAFADPVAVFFFSKSCAEGQKMCPETTASFLNKLTFAWLNRLMVLGYRRGIEMSDLWALAPRDQSSTLVPAFERLWGQEVQRCRQRSVRTNQRHSAVAYTNGNPAGHHHHHHHQTPHAVSERTPLQGQDCGPPSSESSWAELKQRGLKHVPSRQQPAVSPDSGDSDSLVLQPPVVDNEGVYLRVQSGKMAASGLQDGSESARPSLVRVLFRQFGATMAVFLLQRLVSDTFLICCPLILGELISHLNSRPEGREWQGYVLAGGLLVAATLRTVFYAAGSYRAYLVGLQVKSVVIGAVYNKALRINSAAKKGAATSGEITSLMSVDAQRLQEFLSRMFFGVSVPAVLLAVLVIIYRYVGSAVLAALLVLALLVPSTGIGGVCQKKVQERLLVHKDLRVRVFSEILNGIKVLKLYAWEESFERRVSEVRGQELQCLWRVALLYMLLGMCTNLMSYLMTLATYGWYVLSQRDHVLDASTAFSIMSLLSVLTPILESMGMTISFLVQAKVSVRRINDFLCSEELDFHSVSHDSSKHGNTIQVENATFAWDDPAYPTLENIDLTVSAGQLVAVVGPVGAGKSSLIHCLLGEMTTLQGQVNVKGRVAYVAQQAWIQNGTVRDNIVFGQPYVADRYHAVVKACQLERDLSILPAGDMTEIGEKGTNLSGGQKQRVSLARAVYSDRDLYLMDDPLSAVDSHVGKAIFSDIVGPRGILKGKTRVLVTHGIHWLPLVDTVVVLKEGAISEVGSYSRLMQHNGDFAQFLRNFILQENEEVDSEGVEEEEEQADPEVVAMRRKIWADVESATTCTTDVATSGDELRVHGTHHTPRRKKRKERGRQDRRRHRARTRPVQGEADDSLEEKGKLTLSETLVKGRVPLPMYLHYPRAAGVVSLLGAVLLFASFRACSVGATFWLRRWTEDPLLRNHTMAGTPAFVTANQRYLAYYGILGVLQVVLLLAYNGLYWARTIQASRRLHERLITCLFRAPMAFFDTTPSGRVMNRVSADVEVVDTLMPLIIRDIVSTLTVLVATILVLVLVSPLSAAVLLPLTAACHFALAAYVPVSRQCRRMEAVTRSPIFAHFSETISGAATIRAYGATERFVAESKRRVDRNQAFYFTWIAGVRWIQMMLDLVTNLVVFMAAILEIVSPDPSGGSVGLSVSYALQLSYTMNQMVRMVTDFETNIVSVERLKEYSELPSEAPWVEPERRPPPSWPTQGSLQFSDFQTRYRTGLELVLKGLTCRIQGGEKVGIVGRTGAGKSSLSLALFRLIEATGGAILIDGVNIADLGLHDLRSRLTILPQDPVLFSGSLRFNLDPFGEHGDRALWQALQQAHLGHFVHTLPGTLDYQCGEEGLNLSVGQRQLLCLARTLLRRPRVLVLDEATAAVDLQTDALIQNTVRQAFRHCTVLAIAHRLHTVLDYDRILVLDCGRVVEFDTPQHLQASPDSIFTSMMKDAGLA